MNVTILPQIESSLQVFDVVTALTCAAWLLEEQNLYDSDGLYMCFASALRPLYALPAVKKLASF